MTSKAENANYDSIIIGSGAGGLCAGVCLARAGQKVLILEQHYVPGGWCHSFTLNGHRFSPGVHYIGQMQKGGPGRRLYEGLGMAKDLVFFKQVDKGFEHARLPDASFDYPSNWEQFKTDLVEQFPHEKEGLLEYLGVLKLVERKIIKMSEQTSGWAKVKIILSSWTLIKNAMKTLESVIDKYIKDPDLKAILMIQSGDHGVIPSRASFAYHCGVMGHYQDGGYFPMGGGGGLTKAMTNSFKRFGGELRTSTGVKRILLEGKKAVGVELENGEKIYSERLISNADPHVTFEKLLDRNVLSSKFQKWLDNLKYSVSSLMGFVTLEMDVREKGIDSGNYWVFGNNDLNQVMQYDSLEEVLAGDKFNGVFISSSTLKDPASQDGRFVNFELVTFMPDGLFESMVDVNSEDKEYQDFKQAVFQKFMGNLEALIPGAKDHVVQFELGTPRTNKFYVNSTRGNSYGTEKVFNQIGGNALGPKTEIENLYVCGACTMSHGVMGASNSGVMAAAAILGCEKQSLFQPIEGEELTVIDSEDPASWPEWLKEKIAVKERRVKALENVEALSHVDPFHEKKKKAAAKI